MFLCFSPLFCILEYSPLKITCTYRLSEHDTLNVWSQGKQLVLFSRESRCFPRRSRGKHLGKTKLLVTSFQRDHTLSVLLYNYVDFPLNYYIAKCDVRATTAQLYPVQDTFEFDQGHVTKNQPIAVLILLSESLAILQ